MENKTKIVLTRPKAWLNQARPYRVFLDGVERGAIKNDEALSFPVEPGMHKVHCSIAWYSSIDLEINLAPGDTYSLRIRNGMKYYWPSFLVLVVGIAFNLLAIGQHDQRPAWATFVELAMILPAVSYMFYYMSFGRKKYLVLEEDKENVFPV